MQNILLITLLLLSMNSSFADVFTSNDEEGFCNRVEKEFNDRGAELVDHGRNYTYTELSLKGTNQNGQECIVTYHKNDRFDPTSDKVRCAILLKNTEIDNKYHPNYSARFYPLAELNDKADYTLRRGLLSGKIFTSDTGVHFDGAHGVPDIFPSRSKNQLQFDITEGGDAKFEFTRKSGLFLKTKSNIDCTIH